MPARSFSLPSRLRLPGRVPASLRSSACSLRIWCPYPPPKLHQSARARGVPREGTSSHGVNSPPHVLRGSPAPQTHRKGLRGRTRFNLAPVGYVPSALSTISPSGRRCMRPLRTLWLSCRTCGAFSSRRKGRRRPFGGTLRPLSYVRILRSWWPCLWEEGGVCLPVPRFRIHD